jgi:hypothetical protein
MSEQPENQEYEAPAIVSLGSMDELTAATGDSADNSITVTTVTLPGASDARLKTEIETVTNAVGKLRRL